MSENDDFEPADPLGFDSPDEDLETEEDEEEAAEEGEDDDAS